MELKRLVNEKTLEPVQFAEWALSIVAILKSDLGGGGGVSLDDQSKKFAVINTNKGLFHYTRLPYGILCIRDFSEGNNRSYN